MAEFVIDASVVLAWCFEDQADAYADLVLDCLPEGGALAPSIWPLEIGNVLVVAERQDLLTASDSERFVDLLRQLPIEVEAFSEQRMFESVPALAREQSLSAYGAAYLDLAVQAGLPLATLDQALRSAASSCHVPLYQTEGLKQR